MKTTNGIARMVALFAFTLIGFATSAAHAQWAPGELISIHGNDPTYRIYFCHVQPDQFQELLRWNAAAEAGDWSARAALDQTCPDLMRRYPATDVKIIGAAVTSDARPLLEMWQAQGGLPGGTIYLYLQNGVLMYGPRRPDVFDPDVYRTPSSGTYNGSLETPGYGQGSLGQ
ncbi:MAG: hypothetical protein R3B96_02195 [Pirellulaceae bacterium]|nr:hypothetical protein [Planctomycetales bacterium]